jgi:hypothetical protein
MARTVRTFSSDPLTGGYMTAPMLRRYVRGRYDIYHVEKSRPLAGVRRLESLMARAHFGTIGALPDSSMEIAREYYTPLPRFISMLRREPPWHLCRREDVAESVEQLTECAIKEQGLIFGLVAPARSGHDPAYEWATSSTHITAIDDRMLVQLPIGEILISLSELTNDPLLDAVLRRRIAMLGSVSTQAVHPLDPESIVQTIKQLVVEYLR